MSQEIFYEKYRPKQLAHVIGQEVPVKILSRSCAKEFFHHSYLFAGPHGTGKTSTARITAAILTCPNRAQGSAIICGKCPACVAALTGHGSTDIYELDGASNSKIENTRAIIESSRYAPQQFKRKVFIIDECHRLSSAAMTSLLKTLEEPPESVVFILCTTDLSKVPKEIISRCQPSYFKPVPPSAISSHLSRLFASRKLSVDSAACDCIATACRGSVRDAIEMAQEVSIISDGTTISEKDVSQFIGLAGRAEIYELIEAISNKNMIMSFDLLEAMISSNINIRTLSQELSCAFRNIMISKIDSKYINELTKTEQNFVNKVKEKFEIKDVANFISLFEESERAFEVNINNRWVLEATIVKIIGN